LCGEFENAEYITADMLTIAVLALATGTVIAVLFRALV
jgi:hypothetical protein